VIVLPQAHIVHAMPERMRVKVESRRGDEAYFTKIKQGFSRLPGIVTVETNPLTASVLLRHSGDVNAVASSAEENGLFRLTSTAVETLPVEYQGTENLRRIDQHLRALTGEAINLTSMFFLALAAVGISQAIQGNVAVPAVTALWGALHGVKDVAGAALPTRASPPDTSMPQP
jgi:hypothetical protein